MQDFISKLSKHYGISNQQLQSALECVELYEILQTVDHDLGTLMDKDIAEIARSFAPLLFNELIKIGCKKVAYYAAMFTPLEFSDSITGLAGSKDNLNRVILRSTDSKRTMHQSEFNALRLLADSMILLREYLVQYEKSDKLNADRIFTNFNERLFLLEMKLSCVVLEKGIQRALNYALLNNKPDPLLNQLAISAAQTVQRIEALKEKLSKKFLKDIGFDIGEFNVVRKSVVTAIEHVGNYTSAKSESLKAAFTTGENSYAIPPTCIFYQGALISLLGTGENNES